MPPLSEALWMHGINPIQTFWSINTPECKLQRKECFLSCVLSHKVFGQWNSEIRCLPFYFSLSFYELFKCKLIQTVKSKLSSCQRCCILIEVELERSIL